MRNPSNGEGSSDFSLFHLNFLGGGFFQFPWRRRRRRWDIKGKCAFWHGFPFPLLAWQALGDPREDAGERKEGEQEAEAVTAGHSHRECSVAVRCSLCQWRGQC